MKSIEDKLFEKVINVLTENAVVVEATDGRVHASHISTIQNPIFPAISLFLLGSNPSFNVPNMKEVFFQVDLWFPRKMNTTEDVTSLAATIEGLLHRGVLSDTAIGIKVFQIFEETSGPMMHEEDTDLFHYPKRYKAVVV